MNWFLYDRDFCHEKVKQLFLPTLYKTLYKTVFTALQTAKMYRFDVFSVLTKHLILLFDGTLNTPKNFEKSNQPLLQKWSFPLRGARGIGDGKLLLTVLENMRRKLKSRFRKTRDERNEYKHQSLTAAPLFSRKLVWWRFLRHLKLCY